MRRRKVLAQGTVIDCPGCGRRCVVRGQPSEAERPLTRSNTTDGWCATCALARWLTTTEPVSRLVRHSGGDGVRLPHVRDQIITLMRVGNCPISADEVDWEALADRLDRKAAEYAKGGE